MAKINIFYFSICSSFYLLVQEIWSFVVCCFLQKWDAAVADFAQGVVDMCHEDAFDTSNPLIFTSMSDFPYYPLVKIVGYWGASPDMATVYAELISTTINNEAIAPEAAVSITTYSIKTLIFLQSSGYCNDIMNETLFCIIQHT